MSTAVVLSERSPGEAGAIVAGDSGRWREEDCERRVVVVELARACGDGVPLDVGGALGRGKRWGGSPGGTCVIVNTSESDMKSLRP